MCVCVCVCVGVCVRVCVRAGLIYRHTRLEGMAVFRHPNGTYYIIASHLTS